MKIIPCKLLWPVVLCLLFASGTQASSFECSNLFAEEQLVSAIHSEPIWARTKNLTESERQLIRKIFDLNMSETAKLKAAFHTYVQLTLRKQPEQVRARILELMKEEEIWFAPFWDTYSGVMNQGKRVEIRAPLSYQETATLQVTRVHELQHLINFVAADKNLEKAIKASRFGPGADILTNSNLKQRYYDEYAAIRAEWEFISLIPAAILERDIEVITSSYIPERLQKSQLRRIQNASLPFEDYIHAEHLADRHSLRVFQKAAWFARLEVGAVLTPTLISIFQRFGN